MKCPSPHLSAASSRSSSSASASSVAQLPPPSASGTVSKNTSNSTLPTSELNKLSFKVFGTRLTPKLLSSEYSKCLHSILKTTQANLENSTSTHSHQQTINAQLTQIKSNHFNFFPQIFYILLEIIITDQYNNLTAFQTLVSFIDSLVEYKKPKNKDNFQCLALDSDGLNILCEYIDEKFNPLMFYKDILLVKKDPQVINSATASSSANNHTINILSNSEINFRPPNFSTNIALSRPHSASFTQETLQKQNKKLTHLSTSSNPVFPHSSSSQAASNIRSNNISSPNLPQSQVLNEANSNQNAHQSHKPAPPTRKSSKIVTTIHYEIAHFWKNCSLDIRQKIHNSALIYFKIIIKSLAISVQLDKRTLKPVEFWWNRVFYGFKILWFPK